MSVRAWEYAMVKLLVALLFMAQISWAGESGRPENWAVPIELQGVGNLHKVNENLYRSGQPTSEGMKNLKGDERKTQPNGYKGNDPGGSVINFFPLLSGVILLLLIGCSGGGPDQGTSPLPSHKTSVPTILRIIMKWPGDDFASKQDLETRSKIENLIVERGVGRILRDGTGMGWMDIFVEAEERESAKKAIDKIMGEAAPNAEYFIE